MASHRPEILLYGWFGEGNVGDELILSSLVGLVRQAMPSATISVMGSKPSQIAQYHSHEKINGVISTYVDHRPRSIARTLKHGAGAVLHNLHSPDAVIMATGGALSDWNYDSAIPIIDLINCWGRHKVPIYMFGIGAGPITKPGSQQRFFGPLSKVEVITVRDEYSKNELEKLGLNNVRLTQDVVFAAGNLCDKKTKHYLDRSVHTIGVVVAPVCRETPEVYERYVANLKCALSILADTYEVTLIPFQKSYDLLLMRELRNSDRRIKLFEGGDDIRATLAEFEHQDLIIGMRFHAIVKSLMNRKHVIPIVYHPKCFSLASEMGLADYCEFVGNGNNWPVSNIDTGRLVRSVEAIQNDARYCDLLETRLKAMEEGVYELELLSSLASALHQ